MIDAQSLVLFLWELPSPTQPCGRKFEQRDGAPADCSAWRPHATPAGF